MSDVIDIAARARDNAWFRQVIETGAHSQLVVMSIPSGGEIGLETHEDVDQILVVVDGEGIALLDGVERMIGAGALVFVTAGTRHNVLNTGPADLRLYTVYAPPQHAPGTIHRTKDEADADEADHYVAIAAR